LVSLFFRRFAACLTLTATFRTHNAMDAWLENLYGLMAVQRYVCDRTAMPAGPITVFSHSISIAAEVLERAKAVAGRKRSDELLDPRTGKRSPRFDPHGDFTVTVDTASREIIVQHNYAGMRIAEYRGRSAEELERQLARDDALSEISHALYLGREIARKEYQLRHRGSGRSDPSPREGESGRESEGSAGE
jgi:thymidylate synthase